MKHNKRKLKFALLGLILFFILVFLENHPFQASAQMGFNPPAVRNIFGGVIEKKNWRVCLVPVPFFPWIIPYPFIFVQVGTPMPARLYYLYGIPGTPVDSKLFREFEMQKSAYALGNFWPQMDDVFRNTMRCLNKRWLPEADGVIKYIGTSCKTKRENLGDYDPLVNSPTGEGYECRPGGIAGSLFPGTNDPWNPASLIAPIFSVIVAATLDSDDAQQDEYPTYCDPNTSPPGECDPLMPIPDIKANDSDGPITIDYDTGATITWSTQHSESCVVTPTGWTGLFNLGWPTGNLTANTTYTLTCTGENLMSESDSVTVNVNPPVPDPTATLEVSADGITYSDSVSLNAGATLYYRWSSTNANGFSSRISAITPGGVDGCGYIQGSAWAVDSESGSDSGGLIACQSGFTYTIVYTAAETASGKSASDTVTVVVK